MAGNVYALLVGINDYDGRLNSLDGCVDDIHGMRDFLEGHVASNRRHIVPLLDEDATRERIITEFTRHLSAASKDDVAIFYFSGHGSQEPVEEQYWHLEPTGHNQTIVCADSRRPGVPDLADKELNELIAAVAAGGAHVLVVLDCCYSGGGTRDPRTLPQDLRVRLAPPNQRPRPPDTYLPGVRRAMEGGSRDASGAAAGAARHVMLSACESTQLSLELPIGPGYRGVFSAMLQRAMATLGPDATYRDLLGAASVAVRDRVIGQHPVGYATQPGDLDQPLFGGAIQLHRSTITLERYRSAWWIDAGIVHGIQPPHGDATTILAVLRSREDLDTLAPERERPLGRVRVTDVELARSRVMVDEGWEPDTKVRYRTVLTDLPLPPATVEVRGNRDSVALVRACLADSPHVREGAGDPGTAGDRFVVLAEIDGLTVARADASPLAASVPATPDGARTVVARLEHLTRWHLIKRLDNPVSAIANQVTLHVLDARRGQRPPLPGQQEPITPQPDGRIHLRYRRNSTGWQRPYIFVYLHNHSDRHLYCALLNLTDRFRCHSRLFPGELVPAGKTAVAFEGRPIDVSIPRERLEAGGTEVYDWLKLIAAEQRFAAEAYELPALDGVLQQRGAERGRGQRTVLDRLADRAIARDAGEESADVLEWTTALLTLHTERREQA
ncbi:caspase family protein [Actinoplanes sp. M2I2]|uniref:caspase family protein n=1 Tax=Actinoplanes sp. M2I2 TaxID=1734444 RepID=UPI002021172C|nr:caspase family protein [Actinoplanes sp. M2I2]